MSPSYQKNSFDNDTKEKTKNEQGYNAIFSSLLQERGTRRSPPSSPDEGRRDIFFLEKWKKKKKKKKKKGEKKGPLGGIEPRFDVKSLVQLLSLRRAM